MIGSQSPHRRPNAARPPAAALDATTSYPRPGQGSSERKTFPSTVEWNKSPNQSPAAPEKIHERVAPTSCADPPSSSDLLRQQAQPPSQLSPTPAGSVGSRVPLAATVQPTFHATAELSSARGQDRKPKAYSLVTSTPPVLDASLFVKAFSLASRSHRSPVSVTPRRKVLSAAARLDDEVAPHVTRLCGLPAFASPYYQWRIDMWTPAVAYRSDVGASSIADIVANAVPEHEVVDAATALIVTLVDTQKQGGLSLNKSLAHQAMLAALIVRHPSHFLTLPVRGHPSLLAWMQHIYPSMFTIPSEGLVIAWLLQRLVFTSVTWRDSPKLVEAVQSAYVKFLGSSIFEAPSAHPRLHEASAEILGQLLNGVDYLGPPHLSSCVLSLLVKAAGMPLSIPSMTSVLQTFAKHRETAVRHLLTNESHYTRLAAQYARVLWAPDHESSGHSIPRTLSAELVESLLLRDSSGQWWQMLCDMAPSHIQLTRDVLVRIVRRRRKRATTGQMSKVSAMDAHLGQFAQAFEQLHTDLTDLSFKRHSESDLLRLSCLQVADDLCQLYPYTPIPSSGLSLKTRNARVYRFLAWCFFTLIALAIAVAFVTCPSTGTPIHQISPPPPAFLLSPLIPLAPDTAGSQTWHSATCVPEPTKYPFRSVLCTVRSSRAVSMIPVRHRQMSMAVYDVWSLPQIQHAVEQAAESPLYTFARPLILDASAAFSAGAHVAKDTWQSLVVPATTATVDWIVWHLDSVIGSGALVEHLIGKALGG